MFTLDVATHFNKISHKYILQDSSEIFGQYMNIRQVRVSSRDKSLNACGAQLRNSLTKVRNNIIHAGLRCD